MSTPPEELPASGDQAAAPPRRRTRASRDGAGSADATVTVASTADAPAPPRRGRRTPGAAASAVTAAAASAASAAATPSEPAGALEGPDEPAAKPSERTAKSRRRPKLPKPARTPKPPAAAELPAEASSPAPARSEPEIAKSTPDAPKPPKPVRAADPPAAVTSEADAEAVLVEEPKTSSRRFRFPGRVATATVAAAPPPATPPIAAPAPVVAAPPIVAPMTATTRAATVGTERHYRQTVTKVDLWSVTKLSLCFYLSAMFVTIVALVSLWFIAVSVGIVHSIEKFLGDLLSAKNFHFLSATVLRGAILVGLVVVALQVVITVISASFYNIFAELFGGVEITVREEGRADYPDPSPGL
jgi:hypothetical protein